MPDPTVCAVLLTANRPQMAWQAVECYLRQTMPSSLLVFDTGEKAADLKIEDLTKHHRWMPGLRRTVGQLRNAANAQAIAEFNPDILCHWDDDDFSHPNRIAEQVALLRTSGAQAVGYNSLLFWREDSLEDIGVGGLIPHDGEAWLYTGSILGTSLMYKREAWERRHFEPMNNGEDTRWLMGMKAIGTDSIVREGWPMHFSWKGGHSSAEEAAKHGDVVGYKPQALISAAWADSLPAPEPRMIARIHSGNTSNAYNPQVMRAVEKQGGEWKRVSEWDDHCRKVFA